MVVLFENKYCLDKESLTEYVKDVHCKYSRISCYIFLAISLFYTYLSFTSKNIRMIVITMLLYIISLRLISYHLVYIKSMEKSSRALHNGNIPETNIQFTEDNTTLKEGKILIELEYDQIKTIKEYKNIYVLMIGEKNALLLKKDSFTIETFDDFKKFINTHIIK